jgi:D-arabinose 1-dehydrogenase-like Zn-dependent alcohol dehydrogenase
MCHNPEIPGITYDGGYADYMITQLEALAHVPEDLRIYRLLKQRL